MSTATYTVAGMTCGSCADSVKRGLGQVAGVSGVDVDLASGQVTVTSEGPVNDTLVQDAVEEAGYEVKA
jgi:copper chaperone CopZ